MIVSDGETATEREPQMAILRGSGPKGSHLAVNGKRKSSGRKPKKVLVSAMASTHAAANANPPTVRRDDLAGRRSGRPYGDGGGGRCAAHRFASASALR